MKCIHLVRSPPPGPIVWYVLHHQVQSSGSFGPPGRGIPRRNSEHHFRRVLRLLISLFGYCLLHNRSLECLIIEPTHEGFCVVILVIRYLRVLNGWLIEWMIRKGWLTEGGLSWMLSSIDANSLVGFHVCARASHCWLVVFSALLC